MVHRPPPRGRQRCDVRRAPDGDRPTIAGGFDDGHLADGNRCDWLCVRVLGPLIDRHGEATARAIAAWHDAPGRSRRRAVVAFVDLVTREQELSPGGRQLALDTSASSVTDPQRFAQTGVGWVLHELATAAPASVTHRAPVRLTLAQGPPADRRRR